MWMISIVVPSASLIYRTFLLWIFHAAVEIGEFVWAALGFSFSHKVKRSKWVVVLFVFRLHVSLQCSFFSILRVSFPHQKLFTMEVFEYTLFPIFACSGVWQHPTDNIYADGEKGRKTAKIFPTSWQSDSAFFFPPLSCNYTLWCWFTMLKCFCGCERWSNLFSINFISERYFRDKYS